MPVSIILPAYNEESTIRDCILSVRDAMSGRDYEMIVVDDGSTDGTHDILQGMQNITIINNPCNLGYGASLKKGIKCASGDLILIMDADGTYPAEGIPRLMEWIGEYDMVVGARTGNIPFPRRLAKSFLTLQANFLVGRKIPDLNSGMRLFKKELAMKFFHLFPSGFSFTTTLTLAALSNDYTVKYVPIDYLNRKGKSKIQPVKDFAGFFGVIIKIIMYFNPLKFFLPFGLLLIFAGVVRGIYQIATIKDLGELAVILILFGVQIMFLGLIADLIVKRGSKDDV